MESTICSILQLSRSLSCFTSMNASTTTADEVVATCSNPGCSHPGTNRCSACKTSPYCDPICQTADWAHHKEECPGHLRKVGIVHLDKAAGFYRGENWLQTLRYADLALTKLKQLKDRRLETVNIIDKALSCKKRSPGLGQGTIYAVGHESHAKSADVQCCVWIDSELHP